MSKVNTEALSKIVQRAMNLIETEPQMNEPNTKVRITQPLLEALGWDIYNREEVTLEYPVSIGTSTAKVDYALMLEGEPAVFVEAKGFDTDIGEPHARQVISYGKVEDVKWVVVTNGKSIRIYNTSWGSTPSDCLVDTVDVKDCFDKIETLELLSKESVFSQEIDAVARRMKETKDAIRKLVEEKEQISVGITNVLRERLGENLQARVENHIPELVDTLIKKLEGSPHEIEDAGEIPGEVIRSDLLRDFGDGVVAVHPSRLDGINFLLKYAAWGWVRTKIRPKFLALYVSRPHSSVLYIGKIREITGPIPDKAHLKGFETEDAKDFKPGKQIIYLERNSIRKLKDPIPMGKAGSQVQNVRYTTMSKIASAKTTEDL